MDTYTNLALGDYNRSRISSIGELSKIFHGIGIGPLYKILAVNSVLNSRDFDFT